MKKLNNRGFTLTELIVVVAILGILAGAASASINQIFSNQTKKFINECDAMLTRCRIETLSGAPSNTYVQLRVEENGTCYVALFKAGTKVEEAELKNKNAVCTYTKNGDNTVYTLANGNPLEISYNRVTGALAPEPVNAEDPDTRCTGIVVGNSKIILVPATGYHKVGG